MANTLNLYLPKMFYMKAAVIHQFGKPEVLHIEEISEPKHSPDQIKIQVLSSSVNPIDFKQRKGNHKWILGSKFPIVLGYDVYGIVEAVGENTSGFKKGDLVYGVLDNKYGGAYAYYAVGSPKCFAHAPRIAQQETAAAYPLAALTALQAMRDKAQIKNGDKVLIIGAAGGLGHFAVQVANILGAEVHAVSSSMHLKLIEELKPAAFYDYHDVDVLKLTERFNVLFDCVGSFNYMQTKHLLCNNGIYITSLPRPIVLWHKLLAIFSKGKKAKTLLMKHAPTDLNILRTWIEEGKLIANLDKSFQIDEVDKAHAYCQKGRTEGKVLLHISNS